MRHKKGLGFCAESSKRRQNFKKITGSHIAYMLVTNVPSYTYKKINLYDKNKYALKKTPEKVI